MIMKKWPIDAAKRKRPSIQIITAKLSVYLNPVDEGRMQLPTDSFKDVVVAWSRFGGSLRETLIWVVSANVWDWTKYPNIAD